MSEVSLLVNGKLYGGWKTINVTLGMSQIAGSFELGVSEVWPEQTDPILLNEGDRCEVRIDDEVVITGWIDEIGIDYNHSSHSVSVRGRDATGDLVDCAAIYKSGEWKEQTVLQIARDLCAPFGIGVTGDSSIIGDAFGSWSIQDGETVFENIDRMCRHRAILPISDGKGNLQLVRASKQQAPTALVLGENIKAASGSKSGLDRFSVYIVKGQRPVDDLVEGTNATAVKGETKDGAVTRYRPLIIIAESANDAAGLQKRAEWERNVRAGRSRPITYTVTGWKHKEGLWRPNFLVPVRDAFLRTNRDYLITQVRYQLEEDGGKTTQLSLMLPEAFDLVALPEPDSDEDFLP